MQNRLESRPRQSSPWWSSGEAASLSRFRVQLILRNGCRHPQWIANRIACIRSYASALRRSSTDSGRCSLRSERQPSSDKRRSKSLWGRFEPSGERVEIRWGCPVAAVERQTARLTESALFRPVDHQRDSDSDQTTAYSTQLSSGLAEAWPEKRSRAAMRRCCRTSEWVNGQPRLSCPTRRRGVLASIDRRIQMELARLDLAVPKEERKSDS